MFRTLMVALVLSLTLDVGAEGAATETIDLLPDSNTEFHTDRDDAELEGTLEVLYEDWEDGRGHYYHHSLRHSLSTDDGKRLSLEGVQHPDLVTGDRVRVRGIRSGQKLQLRPPSAETQLQAKAAETLEMLQYAPISNTFGPQKIAVFLVNFADNPSNQPFTTSAMKTFLNDYYNPLFRANSYQQTWLEVDVFGWYTMPFVSSGCPTGSIQYSAEQAAVAAGTNLSGYTRRVYFFPTISCGWTGLGTVGGNPSRAWLNGNAGAFPHELGHNLGLYHSHSMSCAPGVLGPNCTTSEYGDVTDIMGSAFGGQFNPFQKQRLGWLDYEVSPPITAVQESGTYTIEAYDLVGITPRALKIQRGATSQAFFVALRRLVSFESAAGVFVHLATNGAGNSSYLLDMTPETPTTKSDGNLAVGKSFTDPVSGVTIRTVSVSGTSATIMVDMGGTGPSCTRSAPRVTASPAESPAVQPRTMVTYNVSVTNADSAGCSGSTFTLQATAPPGWQKTFGASSVTADPGTTVSTTLRITSPVVPTGSYTIVSAATRTTASPVSGSASVLYNVDSGGSPPDSPGTFTDNFDRPDSPVLGNGWSVVTGSLLIQSGEARNQAGNELSLAVQPGRVGATQMVAARFASTSNDGAPRFGVVVRYQNPQNYYICYRQAGPARLVRIAKVQNGVETVLRSVGVGNPAVNAFWTLSCEASGGTLMLRLDGVTKLSTTDGTFSTGSAGYSISSRKVASHRADDFGANLQ